MRYRLRYVKQQERSNIHVNDFEVQFSRLNRFCLPSNADSFHGTTPHKTLRQLPPELPGSPCFSRSITNEHVKHQTWKPINTAHEFSAVHHHPHQGSRKMTSVVTIAPSHPVTARHQMVASSGTLADTFPLPRVAFARFQ